MKQFVVIGLGRFGSSLAEALFKLGNQVLAFDKDRKAVENIKDSVTEAIIADARDFKVLSEFIDDDVDSVIVASATELEMSVLTVLYLKDLGVKQIIAKAKSEDHGKILAALGVHEVIYPEKDLAARLAERLNTASLITHIPLAPEYSIFEIATPDSFIGKTIAELQLRNNYGINVIGIKDVLFDKIDIVPQPDYKFGPDTAMIILCETDEFKNLKFK
jgi:trk system potassium uptake protein TrkA